MKAKFPIVVITIIFVLVISGCIGQNNVKTSEANTTAAEKMQNTSFIEKPYIPETPYTKHIYSTQNDAIKIQDLENLSEIKNLSTVVKDQWKYNFSVGVADKFDPKDIRIKPSGILQIGNEEECTVTAIENSYNQKPHLNILIYSSQSNSIIKEDISKIPPEQSGTITTNLENCHSTLFAETKNIIIVNSCGNENTCGTGMIKVQLQSYFEKYK